jgi:hypothetical protein
VPSTSHRSPGVPAVPFASVVSLLTAADLDAALAVAAPATRAVVGEYLAAPTGTGAPSTGAIELVIDFVVPPADPAAFAARVDAELCRRSADFATARKAGHLGPTVVRLVPPSCLHQWRHGWQLSESTQHAARFSARRDLIDAVLRQARFGFREAVKN